MSELEKIKNIIEEKIISISGVNGVGIIFENENQSFIEISVENESLTYKIIQTLKEEDIDFSKIKFDISPQAKLL